MPRSRWLESLGPDDQAVEWFKPKQRPAWMSRGRYAALPASITVRELRRTVRRPGLGEVTLTMVTTLLQPRDYPAAELRGLRLGRWDVETHIGHLKTHMGMWRLRCTSIDGVRKELAVFRLVYNLVRVVMLEAAARQEVPVNRVSFADALQRMRHARPGVRSSCWALSPCAHPPPWMIRTQGRRVERSAFFGRARLRVRSSPPPLP